MTAGQRFHRHCETWSAFFPTHFGAQMPARINPPAGASASVLSEVGGIHGVASLEANMSARQELAASLSATMLGEFVEFGRSSHYLSVAMCLAK